MVAQKRQTSLGDTFLSHTVEVVPDIVVHVVETPKRKKKTQYKQTGPRLVKHKTQKTLD